MLRLAALRKQSHLSQAEFGKLFSAAQNTVSAWEKGTREMPQDVLVNIANYFNVSVDYLLGRDEQNEKPATGEGDGSNVLSSDMAAQNSAEKKLLLIARKAADIPDSDRDEMIKMFESTIDIYLKAKGKDK